MEIWFQSEPLTKEEMTFLFKVEQKMIGAGISFDSGYSFDTRRRDWHIMDGE